MQWRLNQCLYGFSIFIWHKDTRNLYAIISIGFLFSRSVLTVENCFFKAIPKSILKKITNNTFIDLITSFAYPISPKSDIFSLLKPYPCLKIS
ncbi:unnamed protein product [Moneuplotes crassus]|uniref:Uncharacterized protein n=1 Tax=Euplotes crassus TaxID=5936 RepID=A0AAD2D247_EUPCR|nr:unnamed protein product [Moneuplotes crassus]CAI2377504.1 unnamed protein product [Moneuplotes crassus]